MCELLQIKSQHLEKRSDSNTRDGKVPCVIFQPSGAVQIALIQGRLWLVTTATGLLSTPGSYVWVSNLFSPPYTSFTGDCEQWHVLPGLQIFLLQHFPVFHFSADLKLREFCFVVICFQRVLTPKTLYMMKPFSLFMEE